jgi:IstB-like ATP binding protein
MLPTSNRAVGEWGSVFGDPVVATAVLDRLLHHSHVITIRGDSYRLREKRRRGCYRKRFRPRNLLQHQHWATGRGGGQFLMSSGDQFRMSLDSARRCKGERGPAVHRLERVQPALGDVVTAPQSDQFNV